MDVGKSNCLLIVLACVLGSVSALKCYQCTSTLQTDPCYAMEKSFVTIRSTLCTETEYDRSFAYCYKKILRDADGNFRSIDRGCAYTKSEQNCPQGDSWAQWPAQPKCEVTNCPIDGCNAADKEYVNLVAMVTLLCISFIVLLW